MTKQRQCIYDIVVQAKRHLTAEEVYALAKQQLPEMVQATVYNNLNALCAEGKIRRVKVAGLPDHFDYKLAPHEHIVCDHCGSISDITLGDMKTKLESETGIPLTGYELNMHYICPKCQKEAKAK